MDTENKNTFICKDKLHYDSWKRFYDDNRSYVRNCVTHEICRIGGYLLINETEDIVQEIFIRIWQKDLLSTIQDGKKLKAWLFKLSVNYTLTYFRKALRSPSAAGARETVNIDSLIFEPAYKYARNNEGPFEFSLLKETVTRIRSCIGSLPYNQKKALRLFILGMTHKQISDVLNISAAYTAVLLRRARRKLRMNISEEPLA